MLQEIAIPNAKLRSDSSSLNDHEFIIDPISVFEITIDDVVAVARFNQKVTVADKIKNQVEETRDFLEEKVIGNVIYGINTGFGDLANVGIEEDKLAELQHNLVRSHAVGVGELLDKEIVRAMMFLIACSLSRGCSGVRFCVIQTIIDFLNNEIIPSVPEQGSLGASGDLAPLAHLALALTGEGEVLYNRELLPSNKVFEALSIKPLELNSKEGLALLNGTHMMSAIGSLLAYDTSTLLETADITAALSGDVMSCTIKHTNPRLHQIRPHYGQVKSASNIRELLEGSEILGNHKDCDKVQDAYSIRCSPQVHGASRDTAAYFVNTINVEINSVTDNPLIFSKDGEIISGGNFHGQPLAVSADCLSIALAELANISERRIARLIDQNLSGILPHFLTKECGTNSGLMIAQYTAASLVSENKVLAHPASVDSITSSANQEDHVSMGSIAMRKCRKIAENVSNVLAIELLCGCQALNFRRPLKSSNALELVYSKVREQVDFIEEDRYIANDLATIKKMIQRREVFFS